MQLWSFFEKAVGQAAEATVTHATACTALASGLFRPVGSKQLCQTRVIKDAPAQANINRTDECAACRAPVDSAYPVATDVAYY
jgi:hypothetical protein